MTKISVHEEEKVNTFPKNIENLDLIFIAKQPREIIYNILFSLEYPDIISFFKTNSSIKEVFCTETFWKEYAKRKYKYTELPKAFIKKTWEYLVGFYSLKITENLDLKKLHYYCSIYKNPRYILKTLEKYYVKETMDTNMSMYAKDYCYNKIPIKNVIEKLLKITEQIFFSDFEKEITNGRETAVVNTGYGARRDIFRVEWAMWGCDYANLDFDGDDSLYRFGRNYFFKILENGEIVRLNLKLKNTTEFFLNIYYNDYSLSNEELYGVENAIAFYIEEFHDFNK